MNERTRIAYSGAMSGINSYGANAAAAVTPSLRTLHAELLRLCARIGYSPPSLG